ncbi:MAG: signal peptidase I, partial [Propionibacteriales bacterium]|nr:signal peptidase I [Propionibacteriales bacterium]
MTSGSGGITSDDRDTGAPSNLSPTQPAPASPDPEVDDADTGQPPVSPTPKKALPMWQESLILVGTAVVLALLIKTFFLQAFYIPSGSMRDTLKVDDRILVQKVSYWFGDVQRGDIVVFDDPANWLGEEDGNLPGNAATKALSVIGLYPTGGHLVKRVIGVEGDAVSCESGRVRVNGAALHENGYVTLAPQACDGSWSVVVPPDRLWVLGDNRQSSADSRAHIGDPGGGFIPVDDVVGKVFVVIWPAKNWQFLHRPGTFSDPALDQAAGVISETVPV